MTIRGLAGRVAVVVLGAAGAALLGPELGYCLLSGALLVALARDRLELGAYLAVAVLARAALSVGLFRFTPPDQVIDLVTRSVDPIALLLQNDIWWPRYLFTYPAVIGMDAFGFRFDRTFALYSASLVAIETVVLARAAESAATTERSRPGATARLVAFVFVALICFAVASKMNGRLLVAFIGLGLLLAAQSAAANRGRFSAPLALTVLAGLAFGQMSTGVGAVAAGQAVVGSLVAVWRLPRERHRVGRWVLLVCGLGGPFLLRSELKNFQYFGGDLGAFGGLLEHGAGGYLMERPLLLIGATLVLGVAGVAAVIAAKRRPFDRVAVGLLPVLAAIPIGLGGGLFGFSTLTMVIPAMTVLGAVVLLRWAGSAAVLDLRDLRGPPA